MFVIFMVHRVIPMITGWAWVNLHICHMCFVYVVKEVVSFQGLDTGMTHLIKEPAIKIHI